MNPVLYATARGFILQMAVIIQKIIICFSHHMLGGKVRINENYGE